MIKHKTEVSGILSCQTYNGRSRSTFLVEPLKVQKLLREAEKFIEENCPNEFRRGLNLAGFMQMRDERLLVKGSCLRRTIWNYLQIQRSLRHLELIDKESTVLEVNAVELNWLMSLENDPELFKNEAQKW